MRISVLFVTPKWGDGGGERTWLNILTRLDRERFRPSLAYFEKVNSHFLHEIPADVPVHDLGKERRLSRDLPRAVRALRDVLREERPDVAVSLLHTWGFLLEAARLRLSPQPRIIANEHIHVDSSLAFLGRQRPLLSLTAPVLHRLAYARAARVVGVSERQIDDLRHRFHLPAEKVTAIPVGVDAARLRMLAAEPLDDAWYEEQPLVVAIGRLIPQKAFDDLLRAFARVAQHCDARLVVLGEGELRSQLEALVRELGIEDRVRLPGLQPNPYRFLGRASVFVLSSRWEALPQVIIEALALGIPVVATDCPSGPNELLDSGRYGVLVAPGDPEAMAAAVRRVLDDPSERLRLAALSAERGRAYDVEEMVARYAEEIERASGRA